MPDEGQGEPRIIVDSDWKEEAKREKERLVAAEAEAKAKAAAPAESGDDLGEGFLGLVELLATQAIVSLQGMTTPTGERMPPNIEASKHFIDLLGILQVKTKGNLSESENTRLVAVVTELRQTFTRVVGPAPAPPPAAPPQ